MAQLSPLERFAAEAYGGLYAVTCFHNEPDHVAREMLAMYINDTYNELLAGANPEAEEAVEGDHSPICVLHSIFGMSDVVFEHLGMINNPGGSGPQLMRFYQLACSAMFLHASPFEEMLGHACEGPSLQDLREEWEVNGRPREILIDRGGSESPASPISLSNLSDSDRSSATTPSPPPSPDAFIGR